MIGHLCTRFTEHGVNLAERSAELVGFSRTHTLLSVWTEASSSHLFWKP